jgi:hypothetical protein
LAIILSSTALFFASCVSPADSTPAVAKTGTVVLTFSPALSAKSILPTLDLVVNHYDIHGAGPIGAVFDLNGITGTSSEAITVAVGDWIFTIGAFNAADTLIGSGSVPVLIAQGQPQTKAVDVIPLDGTGTFDLQASIPAGAAANPSVTGSLTPQGGGTAIPVTMTIATDKLGASYSNVAVPDGYYVLSLSLKDGATEKSSLIETVRILKGQTTSGSITFIYNPTTGSVTFTLTVDMQMPITLTFAGAQATLTVGQAMTVSANASRTVSSWQWYLNGAALDGKTTATITLGADLPVGQYRLDCLVRSGPVVSSTGLSFAVSASSTTQLTLQTQSRTISWLAAPTETTISYTGGRSLDASTSTAYPTILADGGNLIAAYSSANAIKVRISSDGGTVWSTGATIAEAGSNLALVKSGSTFLLCFTNNGVKISRSSDGATWSAPTSLATGQINALKAASSTSGAFVAWSDNTNKLYFSSSTDEGANWSSPGTLASESDWFNALELAADGAKLYLTYRMWGIENGDIRFFTSPDAGANWTARPLATKNYPFHSSIVASGSAIYMAYSNDSGLLKSSDSGVTWEPKIQIDSGVFMYAGRMVMTGTKLCIVYYERNGKTLRAASSIDLGLTWSVKTLDERASAQSGVLSVTAVGTTLSVVYADDQRGILFQRSTDGGTTWLAEPWTITVTGKRIDGTANEGDYISGAESGTNIYLAYGTRMTSSALRIARSTNGGTSWESGSLENYGILTSLKAVAGTLYLTYSPGSGTWFGKSSDSGTSWTVGKIDDLSGNGDGYADILVDGQTILISYKAYSWVNSSSTSRLKLARSTDGGTTWSIQEIDPSCNTFGATFLATDGSAHFLAYNDGVNNLRLARSADGGSSWSVIPTALSISNGISLSAAPGSLMVASGTNLHRSTNGGTSWTTSAFDTVFAVDATLASTADGIFISYYDYNMQDLKLAKTVDLGTNWTRLTVDPDGVGTKTALMVNGSVVKIGYRSAAGIGAKFNLSSDGGASFLW